MNPFISSVIRSFVAVPVTILIGLFSLFAFHQSFWLSVVFALIGGGLTHLILGIFMTASFIKKQKLSRREYRYIKKNLHEAKQKIHRMNKILFRVRDLSSVRQRIDVLRISKKIYRMTRKEPKRFYLAEEFYFSHLDSVLELSEKYSFLSAQPKKNAELNEALMETRHTFKELAKVVEEDLYRVISDDIDHLNFEIDVAKHSLKKHNDSTLPDDDEKRWLK